MNRLIMSGTERTGQVCDRPCAASALHSRKRPGRVRGAFTLIELLVVIAIVSLLISLLLPALSSARDSAKDVLCKSGMRQIGLAIQMYLDDQKDPVWFDINRTNSTFEHYKVPRALTDYVGGDGKSAIYKCPRAKGPSSVVDPALASGLWNAGRRFFDNQDEAIVASGGSLDSVDWSQVRKYTEYWFNDSNLMTAKPMRRNTAYASAIVWLADAYEEVPRHSSKTIKTVDTNRVAPNSSRNEIYVLFGDQSFGAYRKLFYISVPPAKDKFGVPGVFYQWGLYNNPAQPG